MKRPKDQKLYTFIFLVFIVLQAIINAERFQPKDVLMRPTKNEKSDILELHDVIIRVIEKYFVGCHLLVLKESKSTAADDDANEFIRTLELRNLPVVVVNNRTMRTATDTKETFPEDDFLVGDKSIGCRVAIVYLPKSSNSLSIRFLRKLRICEQPYMKVLAIGLPGGEQDFLLHHTFRNTIHALYFAIVLNIGASSAKAEGDNQMVTSNSHQGIRVYLRCLYCDNGQSKVILTDTWNPRSRWLRNENFFPDQFKNFNGYTLRMAVKSFFPFAEFVPDSDEPGSSVKFVDCLEVRMLREMSRKLNLTFEAFLSIDDEWGQPIGNNGTWTGLVGELMREDADFGTCLFPEAKRKAVIDFTRMYAPEPFLIVTLKPQLLPKYLAIIKPYTRTMWIAIVVSIAVIGTLFWILHKGRKEILSMMASLKQVTPEDHGKLSGGSFGINSALFYTWGIFFLQTPFPHPSYFFGRLWLSCLMIFSFLILTTYKSALIASLSVPQMSEAVDSIQQLLKQTGWTWGMEPHYSVGWRFLTESSSPNIQEIAKTLEVREIADEMKLVSQGRHAFFTWKNYVKSFIAAEYTDKNGFTPMHISRQHYLETSGSYWGCRKGAPFLRTIVDIKQHLFEGKLLELWLNEIFRETAKRARERKGDTVYVQDEGKQVVLSLNHLQGAFYFFILGQGLAATVLLAEYLWNCLCSSPLAETRSYN